jgi:two-component system cell cycle sensor histidine kinase/response regulator CckA
MNLTEVKQPDLSNLLQADSLSASATATAEMPDSKIVLLAEDEPMIRDLITLFLNNLGYVVHSAENGQDLLEVAEKHAPDGFALMITDLVMPKMGGLELASEIRQRYAESRILFVSGYTDDIVILEGRLNARTAFLRKPFNFSALRTKIEGLLDA